MYALVVGNPGDFCMMYPYYTVTLEESNLTNDTGAWIEYIAVCSCHKTHYYDADANCKLCKYRLVDRL